MKHFTGSPAECLPPRLLPNLFTHPGFWDRYIFFNDLAAGFHGPYVLDAITVDSYDEIDNAAAETLLDAWLNEYEPLLPQQIDGDLAGVRNLLRAADVLLCLHDLGTDHHHERGWVLHSGFLELVAARAGGTVDLLVASGD